MRWDWTAQIATGWDGMEQKNTSIDKPGYLNATTKSSCRLIANKTTNIIFLK